MFDWLSFLTPYLPWMALASFLSLILVVALLPAIVLQLPEDYFVREKRQSAGPEKGHPVLIGILTLIKNLLGLLFIIAGVLTVPELIMVQEGYPGEIRDLIRMIIIRLFV